MTQVEAVLKQAEELVAYLTGHQNADVTYPLIPAHEVIALHASMLRRCIEALEHIRKRGYVGAEVDADQCLADLEKLAGGAPAKPAKPACEHSWVMPVTANMEAVCNRCGKEAL